jgi:hypothetical protein
MEGFWRSAETLTFRRPKSPCDDSTGRVASGGVLATAAQCPNSEVWRCILLFFFLFIGVGAGRAYDVRAMAHLSWGRESWVRCGIDRSYSDNTCTLISSQGMVHCIMCIATA